MLVFIGYDGTGFRTVRERGLYRLALLPHIYILQKIFRPPKHPDNPRRFQIIWLRRCFLFGYFWEHRWKTAPQAVDRTVSAKMSHEKAFRWANEEEIDWYNLLRAKARSCSMPIILAEQGTSLPILYEPKPLFRSAKTLLILCIPLPTCQVFCRLWHLYRRLPYYAVSGKADCSYYMQVLVLTKAPMPPPAFWEFAKRKRDLTFWLRL